jgi:hypothetical protein
MLVIRERLYAHPVLLVPCADSEVIKEKKISKFITRTSVRGTVKPAYNGTANDAFFSITDRFRLIQVFLIRILVANIFPFKTGFRPTQAPLKTGLTDI